jgi:hypothetical protein
MHASGNDTGNTTTQRMQTIVVGELGSDPQRKIPTLSF